jgi:hypothetical protein
VHLVVDTCELRVTCWLSDPRLPGLTAQLPATAVILRGLCASPWMRRRPFVERGGGTAS